MFFIPEHVNIKKNAYKIDSCHGLKAFSSKYVRFPHIWNELWWLSNSYIHEHFKIDKLKTCNVNRV